MLGRAGYLVGLEIMFCWIFGWVRYLVQFQIWFNLGWFGALIGFGYARLEIWLGLVLWLGWTFG